ncbi:MAG TPA: lysoplasmalogenase, partial [Bryobacteraceae bacterium]|nr:lysoplasmalogenase [Bryobacteraceae bacterium]
PAVLVVSYSIAISAWLFPSLGSLQLPVAIYMCAITAMAVTAILARFSTPWVAIGAILFVVSDSLLAIDKFKTPVPYRDILVWSTYYGAQYAITTGCLKENIRVPT